MEDENHPDELEDTNKTDVSKDDSAEVIEEVAVELDKTVEVTIIEEAEDGVDVTDRLDDVVNEPILLEEDAYDEISDRLDRLCSDEELATEETDDINDSELSSLELESSEELIDFIEDTTELMDIERVEEPDEANESEDKMLESA